MTDIVRTTGRPMTKQLQYALDNMHDREQVIAALTERTTHTPHLAALYDAVCTELLLGRVSQS